MITADKWAYCRPDEMWSLGATVTGTVDTDYVPAWLTDGRPAFPVRGAGGSPGALSLSLSGPAGDVGVVAIVNHNLIVAVTIGGDVSATITPSATRLPNGITLNAFTLIEDGSTAVTDLTLAVGGNDEPEVIGEFVAGALREFTPIRIADHAFEHDDLSDGLEGELLNIPPYDEGTERRILSGSQYYTTAERDDLIAWWQSQRGGSLPSLLIPDPSVNDAWLVQLLKPKYRMVTLDPGMWLVTLTFVEYPRYRW